MPDTHKKPRQIVGISMSPDLAVEVKREAAERGITVRNLFEDMWTIYTEQKKDKKS